MAQYTIKRSCGHEEKITLFGKQKDRDWRMGQEREKKCLACWKKAKEDNPDPPQAILRKTTQGVEIVVLKSFEIKDQLKERGYHYKDDLYISEMAGPMGILGMGSGQKGWVKIINEEGPLMAEVDFLEGVRAQIKIRQEPGATLAGMFEALLEGRPEFLP